jgi:hypothetical protein
MPTIALGENWQTRTTAEAAGSIFSCAVGNHGAQTVVPKAGNQYIAAGSGVVLDGGGATQYAFNIGDNTALIDVILQGLTIKRYNPAAQFGMVKASNNAGSVGALGWQLLNCDLSESSYAGVRVGYGMRIIGGSIHHNGVIGYLGRGGTDFLMEDVDVSYNNTNYNSYGNEAGGGKLILSTNAAFRRVHGHHNNGYCLWTDFDNIGTLYEYNNVHDNGGGGINHELSQAAIIRYNTVRRNGFQGAPLAYPIVTWNNWLFHAGIQNQNSRDVEVHDNIVEDNARGIVGIMQDRSGSGPGFELEDFFVHHNDVRITSKAPGNNGHRNVCGLGQDVGDQTYYTARNNRFENNRYKVAAALGGASLKCFTWLDAEKTFAEWQAVGQDL